MAILEDIICLSQVPWEGAKQRPHYLLSRCATYRRVFFVEPAHSDSTQPHLEIKQDKSRVWLVTPHLPPGLSAVEQNTRLASLMKELLAKQAIRAYILWYNTPLALEFTRSLAPRLAIYDILQPADLSDGHTRSLEMELLRTAHVVVNDGQKAYYPDPTNDTPVYLPGSLELGHFHQARSLPTPRDEADLAHPRLGFMGPLNDSLDYQLLAQVAEQRPDWNLVFIGPINIDPGPILEKPNIHYLSSRSYHDLPAYLSAWDVALLPYAPGAADCRASGLQTGQYLAAGLPVVATHMEALSRIYTGCGLVRVAETAGQFIDAIQEALDDQKDRVAWLAHVDQTLIECVWEQAWEWMMQEIEDGLRRLQTAMAFELRPVMPNMIPV